MVKTRSQAPNIVIKKEEDCKDTQLLNTTGKVTKGSNKITKRKTSTNEDAVLPVVEIKLENETDKKPLLQAPSKAEARKRITEEQFERLIQYINKDNMSIRATSRKANISETTGYIYYIKYKEDPKINLFTPNQNQKKCTHQEIKTLVKYIVDDGMSVSAASLKAKMAYSTGYKYSAMYSQDPNLIAQTT